MTYKKIHKLKPGMFVLAGRSKYSAGIYKIVKICTTAVWLESNFKNRNYNLEYCFKNIYRQATPEEIAKYIAAKLCG